MVRFINNRILMVKMDNYYSVKLDKIDRKLLLELDRNCRITDTQLAKKIGRSREATKYRIQQLIKKDVLKKFTTSINHAKFGITYYKIFLQLENIPDEKEKLFKFIKNHKKVPWYGICSGIWDYIIGISAKSPMEFDEIKNEIFSKFKHLIIKKEIGVMVETKQYLKKYLIKDNSEPKSFAGDIVYETLEPIDEKILNTLSNNARIPIVSLADKVNSNVKTVLNRIERLEKKGIILGYRIWIDVHNLGLEYFKVFLYFRSISKEEEKKLLQYLFNLGSVIYYIKMIAPWDSELELVVQNYQELNQILDNLRREFHGIIRNHEVVEINNDEWIPGM
jgi:Lrp/AsnC family leucine-responsive transcriptional regulator